MLRRLSRQLYRNKTLLATVLIPPPGGQDSHPRSQDYNFRNPNHRKEKQKARQLAKMSLYIEEKDWKKKQKEDYEDAKRRYEKRELKATQKLEKSRLKAQQETQDPSEEQKELEEEEEEEEEVEDEAEEEQVVDLEDIIYGGWVHTRNWILDDEIIVSETIQTKEKIEEPHTYSEEDYDNNEEDEITEWLKESKNNRQCRLPCTEFRPCQINLRGSGDSAKRIALDRWGERYQIDAFTTQENKVNSNCMMNTENYLWFISSDVKNEDREKADKKRINNQRIGKELTDATVEKRGVGVLVSKKLAITIESIEPISSRLMMVTLKGKANINIISAYAPPSNAPEDEKEAFMSVFRFYYEDEKIRM